MKLLKLFFYLFFFIILSCCVIGLNSYPQPFFNDSMLGVGFWNEERSDDCSSTEISCITRNLNNPNVTILVDDLDNDSVNEIVVFDGTEIRLYHNADLEIIDAFTSTVTVKAAILYDIDGDDFVEIIVSGINDLEIIEYNGTDMFNQTTFLNGLTGYESGSNHHYLGCDGANRCVVMYEEIIDGGGPNNGAIEYATFNSTDIIDEGELAESNNNNVLCLPSIPVLALEDYDNDGDNEFIITYGDSGSPDGLRINWLFLNSTMNLTSENDEINTNLVNIAGTDCNGVSGNPMRDLYTSPLVFNIDGSISNGLETVIGVMISSDDFKMYSYSSNGNSLDDYPEIANGEGILISNMIRANVFTDTGRVDFCVMGYENDADLLNLVCASEQTGHIPETTEFDFNKAGFYNVSNGFNLGIHSTQQDSTLTDGNNLDEFTSSYGIFRLDFVLINELELIWENPRPNGFLFNIDVEKIGVDDILVLTSTNIWYIDDLFINENAEIERITTNPSILSVIRINETVSVTITCLDEDGDNVRARLVSYLGESNEQDSNYSAFSSSGATFPFNFEANVTTTSSLLEFHCQDTEHNSTTNLTLPFSIGLNGIQFGDALFDSGSLIEEEEVDAFTGEGGTNVTITSNMIRVGIIDFCNTINITPTLLMILLMVFTTIGVLALMHGDGKFGSASDLKMGIYLSLGFSLFILIGFTYLRLISTAIIGTMFILLIAGIVVVLYSKAKSGNEF